MARSSDATAGPNATPMRSPRRSPRPCTRRYPVARAPIRARRPPRSRPKRARRSSTWYADRGRPLAFRDTTDPYAILVSEAMAQQTQAARAGEALEAVHGAFPTVAGARRRPAGRRPARVAGSRLRPAGDQPVAGGAGHRRRARRPRPVRPRRASRPCRASGRTRPGRWRRSRSACRSARSTRTSGACSGGSSAGDVGVLDRGGPAARRRCRRPARSPGAWTHALMDIGATLCKPRKPLCEACPAQPWCRYAAARRRPSLARPRRPRGAGPIHARPRAGCAAGSSTGSVPPRTASGSSSTAPIGEHDQDAVDRALDALARDGVIELDAGPTAHRRARLPT